MTKNHYQISLPERCAQLLKSGFVRDEHRIWRHGDERAVGESVVAAITDESFLRYLGIEIAEETDEQDEERMMAG